MLDEKIESHKQVDATGLSCPMPLLKTKALSEMKPGEILEILSSDPGSKKDIPEFGNKKGNVFLGDISYGNGVTKYYIQKGTN
jgi:tRNA 2-thiouridine synthesizing protein A